MSRAIRLGVLYTVLLTFSLTVLHIRPVSAFVFQDISGHWARDSALRLACSEIVSGYNGKFNPDKGVTRAEFAAMIVKAMGLADQAQVVRGSSAGYMDVPPSHWASGFIIIARETGVISGYPDSSFRPAAMIRRDEITSILVRVLQLTPDENMKDPLDTFKDGKEIANWALNAVKAAYNNKLVNGFPDGSFYPARYATRGEAAVLIEKVLNQFATEFTFYGKVQNVNEADRKITLDIHGQIESFQCTPGVQIITGGASGKLNEVKPGSSVFVILDGDGRINFIQTTDESYQKAGQLAVARNGSASSLAYVEQNHEVKAQSVDSIIVTEKGMAGEVSGVVQSQGGRIKFINEDTDFILAELSGPLLEELEASPMVAEIAPDRRIMVNKLSTEPEDGAANTGETNPGQSLNVTKKAIKAPEFVHLTHSDGKNQIIAIIDTGIDPGHPDLQKTSGGQRKIVDWQDFTNEGDIDTSSLAEPAGNNLNLANGTYYLGSIASTGGKFRYGYLREIDLTDANGRNGMDLNFNGSKSEVFAVLLADRETPGVYDTVYVDTDCDRDFTDEKPLHLFSRSPEYASFTGNNGLSQLSFVLTKIEEDASKVNLGFDGNDHGTHIAGIAAANGKIKGVAPGVQLMALKVLDAAGYGNLSTITKAIVYAATHGAKIINLSLGFPTGNQNGSSLPARLLNSLSENFGVVFVAAAGNDGPGLSTVATPGDAAAALCIGAFNNPEMWKADYGWDVPGENIWFFSSVGPHRDGTVSPSVVAPGSVTSTVPLRDGKQYYQSEGTSMAAPHVAGALALLMEVAQRNNLKANPQEIKRAIEAGARLIPGYAVAEQGYGVVDLTMSWTELLSLKSIPQITAQIRNLDSDQGAGIFFREKVPQKLTLYLHNTSKKERTINLDQVAWFTPEQDTVTLPPEKTRAIDVNINIPEQKGLFSAIMSGDDLLTYGRELEVPATVVNPYVLDEDNRYSISLDDNENPAQYKRYYFKVPSGADALKMKLTVPNGTGRSRVFLFDPNGRLVSETEFAGINPGGAKNEVYTSNDYPAAGVWEIVVYSSASLSAYNLNKSYFNLNVSLEGVKILELPQKDRDIIIGIIPQVLRLDKKNYITLQVRDRYTKRPFEGFLEIDGRIYFTHRGRVILPVDAKGDNTGLLVRTVPESPMFRPWEISFTLPLEERR